MVEKPKILEDLEWLSDRISTQVRTVALGLIAFVWVLVVGDEAGGLSLSQSSNVQLIAVAALAIAVLFLDFLQYFFGYVYTNAVRKDMERRKVSATEFDYTDWRYRLRMGLFWAKQIALMVAVAWLGVIIALALMRYLIEGGMNVG